MTNGLPVLYSFRRCPYAIRARMTLCYSGVQVELREVVLRDMPHELLACSPKATVPVLQELAERADTLGVAPGEDCNGSKSKPATRKTPWSEIAGLLLLMVATVIYRSSTSG